MAVGASRRHEACRRSPTARRSGRPATSRSRAARRTSRTRPGARPSPTPCSPCRRGPAEAGGGEHNRRAEKSCPYRKSHHDRYTPPTRIPSQRFRPGRLLRRRLSRTTPFEQYAMVAALPPPPTPCLLQTAGQASTHPAAVLDPVGPAKAQDSQRLTVATAHHHSSNTSPSTPFRTARISSRIIHLNHTYLRRL